jgi:uncharacterized protein (DUF433 family)
VTFATSDHKYVQLDDRGVPVITGTTMKVVELATAQKAYGWSPEAIHFQHPYLSMSQIQGASHFRSPHPKCLSQSGRGTLNPVPLLLFWEKGLGDEGKFAKLGCTKLFSYSLMY